MVDGVCSCCVDPQVQQLVTQPFVVKALLGVLTEHAADCDVNRVAWRVLAHVFSNDGERNPFVRVKRLEQMRPDLWQSKLASCRP